MPLLMTSNCVVYF